MPFVTGIILEGDRDCGFDDPSFSDVESLFGYLLDASRGMLTLEGPDDVQLTVSREENDELMINWHDWNGESFVIVGDAATARAAMRTFYDDGTRDPLLAWEKQE